MLHSMIAYDAPCRFDMARWKRYYHWNRKKPTELAVSEQAGSLLRFWASSIQSRTTLMCSRSILA
jgi:hypothetical protein